MTEDNEIQAMSAVLTALQPLDNEGRARVVDWATQKLSIVGVKAIRNKPLTGGADDGMSEENALPLSSKGKLWCKQNQISQDLLSEIFHFEGDGVEIIVGEIPGNSIKDKVRNAYVLLGLSNYLATGDATLDDRAGRALCERFGIYDHTNHSKAFKGGNELTGSSKNGWVVTVPGLKHGAMLVKQASKDD